MFGRNVIGEAIDELVKPTATTRVRSTRGGRPLRRRRGT
jgi:hypothetical protein